MGQGFGMEAPGRHGASPGRRPVRFLVVIDAGGATIARLFLDKQEPAGEIDASTEEVTLMTRGLTAQHGASSPEWDHALQGHSQAERDAARIFTLDL